jgi:hypothetical protein
LVYSSQLIYELNHLKNKLKNPLPLKTVINPEPHPLFRVIRGEIEIWEKVKTNKL